MPPSEAQLYFRDIMFNINKLKIIDDPMHFEEREKTFINVKKNRGLLDVMSIYSWDKGVEPRRILKSYLLQIDNEGSRYTRTIVSLSNEFAAIGGLIRIFSLFCMIIYVGIGTPFRQLSLSIAYQQLIELTTKREELEKQETYVKSNLF